jgi:hypothetical protein
VAEHLPPDDPNYPLPTLIVSHADAVLIDTIPLRALIQGVSEAHLPLHAHKHSSPRRLLADKRHRVR